MVLSAHGLILGKALRLRNVNPEHPKPVTSSLPESITSLPLGELASSMGIVILEMSADRAVASMPVAGNRQPFGLLHGGASAVLAETLGSLAANIHAGPNHFAVGIELSCSHHRSATEGLLTAVATPVSAGRTLATYDIVITDDSQRRICTARLTCLIRERPPVST